MLLLTFRALVENTVKVAIVKAPDITLRLAIPVADITPPTCAPTPLNVARATEDITTDT